MKTSTKMPKDCRERPLWRSVRTGVHTAEKLYEEMFFSAENVITTDHPKVLRARNGILPEGIMRRIEALVRAAEAEHPDDELRLLLRVPVHVAFEPDGHEAIRRIVARTTRRDRGRFGTHDGNNNPFPAK